MRTALQTIASGGHRAVKRCLAFDPAPIEVLGWDALCEVTLRHDRPGKPITAIGIDISAPGHIGRQPDAAGAMDPYLETNFYSDAAFPFSTADRAALLGGYDGSSSEWQGNFVNIDEVVTVTGLGELYGATFPLDHWKRDAAAPEEFDAAVAGSCFVAVLLHNALAGHALATGLPRAMTLLVGSNESYPYFDAPAVLRDAMPVRAASEQPQGSPAGSSGTALRQWLQPAEAAADPMPNPQRRGHFGRLLGR